MNIDWYWIHFICCGKLTTKGFWALYRGLGFWKYYFIEKLSYFMNLNCMEEVKSKCINHLFPSIEFPFRNNVFFSLEYLILRFIYYVFSLNKESLLSAYWKPIIVVLCFWYILIFIPVKYLIILRKQNIQWTRK